MDVGSRYVEALATRDTETLVDLFAAHVLFLGLTPMWSCVAHAPEQVVEDVLYEWFGPTDVVEVVEHVEVSTVVDRHRVVYRFRVRNPDGVFRVEQCAYFDLDADGRISRMHVLCSGFLALADGGTT